MNRGENVGSATAPGLQRSGVYLAAWTMAVAAVAASGALFGPDAWYEALQKPQFTPPGWVFGVVWPLLYASMVFVVWRLLRAPPIARRRAALILMGVQLALNALWTPLFFGAHQPGLAFLDICALWGCLVGLCVATAPLDRSAALALVPYVLWITFALILNGVIVMLN